MIYPKNKDILSVFNLIAAIIKNAANNNWTVNQLTEDLKKVKGIDEDQKNLFVKFWNLQRNKVHELMVQKSKFGNVLKSLEWRVDVQTKTATEDNLNQPSALVEMMIGKLNQEENNQVFTFEMDKSELNKFISQIKDLQDIISKKSSF